MRGRLPLFVLLASSLTFLASLFLPWRELTSPPPSGNGIQQLLNLFAEDDRAIDGWAGIAGDVAVLLVVAIVLATVAALLRPRLGARLPVAGLAAALGYFAVAVAVEMHKIGRASCRERV